MFGLPADHVPVTVHRVIFGWHVVFVVVVHETAMAVTEVFELYNSTDKVGVVVITVLLSRDISGDAKPYRYNHCSRDRAEGGGGGEYHTI